MSYKGIRTTVSKKDCTCPDCKKAIKAGGECVVNPKTKEVWCPKCGKNKTE